MSINLNKNKGFTLIELLVVVSIVSLLSSVVLSSLNSVRLKARNVARIEMAYTLRNALMLGLGETGSLPNVNFVCLTKTCYGTVFGGATANATMDAYLAPNLPTKPDDSFKGLRSDGGIPYWISVNPGYGYPIGSYFDYILEGPASCGVGASPRAGNWVGSPWLECLVPLK